jgi:hypothetical protein
MGKDRLEGELQGGLAYWMKQGDLEKLPVVPGNYSNQSLLSYCRAFDFNPAIVGEFEQRVRLDLLDAVSWLSLLC